MLSKYGFDLHYLLYKCDQTIQQTLIQSFSEEDQQIFQQEIKKFDTGIQDSMAQNAN